MQTIAERQRERRRAYPNIKRARPYPAFSAFWIGQSQCSIPERLARSNQWHAGILKIVGKKFCTHCDHGYLFDSGRPEICPRCGGARYLPRVAVAF